MEVLFEVRMVEGGEKEQVDSLVRIIGNHSEYIQNTTKGPVRPLTPDINLSSVIIEDEQKVSKPSFQLKGCG